MTARANITIYLVRHGETDFNREGRFQGTFESVLNDTGRAQASRLAEALKGVRFSGVYSSPLGRALETAGIVMRSAGFMDELMGSSGLVDGEIVVMDGLKELDYGEWQGLSASERMSRFPVQEREWWVNPWKVSIPGAESLKDFYGRVSTALSMILASHGPGESVLVSGHGHVNRMILMNLLKLEEQDFHNIVQQNGQCQKLVCNARGQVLHDSILM